MEKSALDTLSSDIKKIEEKAFKAGYEKGYSEGYLDGVGDTTEKHLKEINNGTIRVLP